MRGLKISVVVIAKNAERTIANCLSSISLQSVPPHETVVVDGHSTDGTRETVARFPVKLISSPSNDTYGLARNLGVKASSGDVVAFLDSDDYAERDWLEQLVNVLSTEDVGMVTANRDYFYRPRWFGRYKWGLLGGREKGAKKPMREAPTPVSGFGKYLGTSGSALRKEAIVKAGHFDEDMFFGCEDMDLAARITQAGYRIVFVPAAVIHFSAPSSVVEWLKESFWRRGMGYGALRRKHGHYQPPLITPLATFLLVVALLASFSLGNFVPFYLAVGVAGLFLLWRGSSYSLRTGSILQSFAYAALEVLARDLAFLGFSVGYFFPASLLRRMAGRVGRSVSPTRALPHNP